MFNRHVTMKLKSNSGVELTSIIEKKVIPLLRKQKGFLDEVTLISQERSEATGNSFWNTKADAEAYNSTGYPEVLKFLTQVVDGTPRVETYEVSNSTFHKIAAGQAS